MEGTVVSGNVSIQAAGSPSALSSNTVYRLVTSNPDEYFLVENRQPLGYDSGLNAEDGGGIYCGSSSPTIPNCIISNNSADSLGGGIFCLFSPLNIINCTISNNWAEGKGGGIRCSSSSAIIINCIIADNVAKALGGGIYCHNSSPIITNCTICRNSSSIGGGIRCYNFSSPTITNCIFWKNSPNEITTNETSSPTVTYSDIQGGYAGTGNIDDNPLFIDSNTGVFYFIVDSSLNFLKIPTMPFYLGRLPKFLDVKYDDLRHNG